MYRSAAEVARASAFTAGDFNGVGLAQPVEPAAHLRRTEAQFPTHRNADRSAMIGAQVVDRLHLHPEVLREFTRGEHGLESEPRELFPVHIEQVRKTIPGEPNPTEHLTIKSAEWAPDSG